ncbi:hypothetical protein [Parvimonas micra]|uniref:DUF1430 domain-containing protein n=1 Tax=Parvimonas micra TaxID=33033 RepID=A0A9X3HFF3_9FIRM|nr:hypothetical protein [Parvimonas micra]MCZ7407677.1 hypothetical protein [Parvimonas micra]MCZ7410672.1 hypothetical protein [Parvimonas micra]MCZ7412606.1 hypothetical protein [Parvimonas micra]WBB36337.1 hypothetical protein NM218_04555 [Parvimonas micra]
MVIDNIKLGFRDLKRNTRIFILFGLLILSISVVLSFSTYALNLALKESKDTEVSYFAIPVSYEMKDFIKVEDRVDKLLKKGGYTKFVSEYVNEEKGIFIQIFIGKFQKSSENRVLFAINSEDLELFKQKEKTLKVVSADELDKIKFKTVGVNLEIDDDNLVFLEVAKKETSLSDFKLNPAELKDLIEGTKFTDKELKNGLDEEFEKAILNSDIVFKKHINSVNMTDVDFILKYIYFYVFLLLLAFLLSFGIFIKNLYKRLLREYKIHIICGATKKSIFIRNSVFVLSLAVFNFMIINFLNRFNYDIIFFLNIGLNIVFVLLLEFVILNMLIREDLSTTLMGGE